MKRTLQTSFFIPGSTHAFRATHGGSLDRSHSKRKRPVALKSPMHLVLRSSLAKGKNSFLRQSRQIRQLIDKQTLRFHVRIYDFANAGNHLHLLVKADSRKGFLNFLRAISGLIARVILGAQRGKAATQSHEGKKRFWDARPFSRIISWGKEYAVLKKYLLQNRLEAWGFIIYRPRATRKIVRSG